MTQVNEYFVVVSFVQQLRVQVGQVVVTALKDHSKTLQDPEFGRKCY